MIPASRLEASITSLRPISTRQRARRHVGFRGKPEIFCSMRALPGHDPKVDRVQHANSPLRISWLAHRGKFFRGAFRKDFIEISDKGGDLATEQAARAVEHPNLTLL